MKLLQFAALRFAPFVVLLLLTVRSHAQAPIFSISNQTTETSASVAVDVRVQNFTMIVGAQFSIEWDSTKLEYTGLGDFAFEATAEENFNLTRTINGQLGYLYFDPTTQGMDLEDSSNLFRVHFNVLANDGEQVELNFGDAPVVREVVDTSITAIEATYEGGIINVGETSAARDAAVTNFQLQAAPNPFTESTQISWSSVGREAVQVRVLNTAGQVIRQFEHPRGADSVFTLRAKDLPASGTYLIELHTQNGKTTHKVAFVKP